MLTLLLILMVLCVIFVLGGLSTGGSAHDAVDDDLDEMVELDILSDGRLDGHIGPRDEEW